MPRPKTRRRKPPPPFVPYGVVRVLRGKHKGELVYYDNDSDAGGRAIVYVRADPTQALLTGDWEFIPLRWLWPATPEECQLWERQTRNDVAHAKGERRLRELGFPPQPLRPEPPRPVRSRHKKGTPKRSKR